MQSLTSPALSFSAQSLLHHLGEPCDGRSAAPVIVLLSGLPGSGKSTFARQLSKETGAIVLESDELRRVLFSHPNHDRQESSALFIAIHEVARHLAERGYPFILDATNLKLSDRQPFIDLAAALQLRLLMVAFQVPWAETVRRLSQREADEAGLDIYRRMAAEQQPISQEHWLVDTSLPESVRQAFAEISTEVRSPRKPAVTPGGKI